MEFEWEPSKAKSNLRKHAIPFDYAIRVFLDENRLEQVDSRTDYRETRWITIGLKNNQEIVVVYTVREETIRIISARRQTAMKEMTTGTVKFKLDPNNLPELTEEQKAQLNSIKDEDIDYSDIPSQIGVQWKRPGALIPIGNKHQVTLRLDADVLNFFKKKGKRYQSRINAVLREYVNAHH